MLEHHATDAEAALLGSLLLSGSGDKDWVAEIFDSLSVNDFFLPKHQVIYAALSQMFSQGEFIDSITALARLRACGDEPRSGGAGYLADLISSVVLASNARVYIKPVLAASAKRRVAAGATRLLERLPALESAAEVEAEVDAVLASLQSLGSSPTEYMDLGEVLTQALARADDRNPLEDEPRGVRTGLVDLDHVLSPLKPGQLVVVGGRPGSGKSLLCFDIARDAALRQDKRVLFVSLEMSFEEMGDRAAAAEFHVPLANLTGRALSSQQWQTVASYASPVMALSHNLLVSCPDYLDLPRLAALVRTLSRAQPLDLVVIDYLQLMQVRGKFENRQQQVASLSAGAKQLARRFSTAVLVASQLNRASEARADRRPALADLRESGTQEQDADVVLLIHRPGQHDELVDDTRAEVMLVKQRNGPTGNVSVFADLAHTRFANLSFKSLS